VKEFPITPLGDLIFVRRENDYLGPIVQVSLERRVQKSLRGKVIAVGPGRPLPDGSAVPMELKIGDGVCFGIASGMEAKFEGIDILCMREEDVLGVLE
jgi:chaperonin GroES